MGRAKYVVTLSEVQREEVVRLTRSGKSSARMVARAHILAKADEGWTNTRIAEALHVTQGTVCRTKRRFVEAGLEDALSERPRPGRPPKLDERGEAHLIALACSRAPEGHDHWTLRLLAGKLVELGMASSISHEGVRKRLKKTPSNRGRRRNGASLR